jgi:hypothetical protein
MERKAIVVIVWNIISGTYICLDAVASAYTLPGDLQSLWENHMTGIPYLSLFLLASAIGVTLYVIKPEKKPKKTAQFQTVDLSLVAIPSEQKKHDVSLPKACRYIITRDWDNLDIDVLDSSKNESMHDAQAEIEQKAANGELAIYGRRTTRTSGPLLEIPREFWQEHGIETMACMYTDVSNCTTEKPRGNNIFEVWQDLYTSKEMVEKYWPRKKFWEFWKK